MSTPGTTVAWGAVFLVLLIGVAVPILWSQAIRFFFTAWVKFQGRRVDGVLVVAVVRSEVGMIACPGEVIGPEVSHPVLPFDLEPAPQDVQVRSSPDEVPALGGFLHLAVEAEEQEDVAAANALLV